MIDESRRLDDTYYTNEQYVPEGITSPDSQKYRLQMPVELLRKKIAGKSFRTGVLTDIESTQRFKFGIDALDSLFEKGVPRGQLIELTGNPSSGKRSLLFEILAKITTRSRVLLVDVNSAFFAPSALAHNVQLSNVIICNPDDALQGIVTAERMLRQEIVEYAFIDLTGCTQPLREALLHRLRIETVRSRGLVFFLTESGRSIFPPSLMSLRLTVQRKEAEYCEVTVTKSRISPEGMKREFKINGISQSRLPRH